MGSLPAGVGAVSGLASWPLWEALEGRGSFWHPQGPLRRVSLLGVVPDEKPQGGEVPFGGSVVDRQGARVCGHVGIPTAVTQQPVHHLGVAEAGSQMQDCGTRTVFVLWKESPLAPKSCPSPLSGSGSFPPPTSPWGSSVLGHLTSALWTSAPKWHRHAIHGGLSENRRSRL